MNIAIACSGLEHVHRGFESASLNLFQALRGKAAVTLFKGSGKASADEVVVPTLKRNQMQPLCGPQRAYYWEQATFAASLYPEIRRRKIDVVHYSDGAVGNALYRLRGLAGGSFKLLLCNSAPFATSVLRPDIHLHQVSKEYYGRARHEGFDVERMDLVPYGIDPGQFGRHLQSDLTREAYGIPKDCWLILSLAALNKSHKRVDYLIREVAKMGDKSSFLCVAGEPSPDLPELRALAFNLLPGRHSFMTVPRAEVPHLLAAADAFVLGSLTEGFGMVFLEAMASCVPTIAHSGEHFQWLLGDAASLVDMRQEGEVSVALRRLRADRSLAWSFAIKGRRRVEDRFSWETLTPQYLEMYDRVCNLRGHAVA